MARSTGKSYSLRSVKAEQLTFDPSKPVGEDDKGSNTNADELAEWSGGTVSADANGQPQVVVNSREGTRVANVGDYVVELSENNFTVMTERDFAAAYDVK
jgi:hypothetical protein